MRRACGPTWLRTAIVLAVVAFATGACGASTGPTGSTGSTASAGSTRVSAAPRVLSATAVAYLPSSLKRLSAGALAREADAPGLADALHRWGFAGASERYFQGESHQLQVVDSRTLSFRSTDGAAAFVRWVAGHASAYVGSYPARRPLAAGGRRGTLIIAQPCQCHLANPAFLGVVSAGGTVSWLEINGPRATPATLVRLLARAP